MLSGRGMTGGRRHPAVCGMGAIKVGMGLISGQRMTPGKPLALARSPAEASGRSLAAVARHAGRLSRRRVAGGAVAAAGAAHQIGNHAADGHADGEQDGQRESQEGARHALGRLGLDAAGGQREDGGQGGAGGEARSRPGRDDAAAPRRRRFAG